MQAGDGHRQAAQLGVGDIVDHFKVVRLVGRGGMGVVYLARDTKLGRKVALKLIRPEKIGTPESVERFMHEARVTARFSHPHIVTIYAVGEFGDCPYIALEYLSGETLRQRAEEERPGLSESLRMCLAIAEALKEAHSHQVLHRDLKPDNVVIPKDGRLRVLDFGLARSVSARDIALDATVEIPESDVDLTATADTFLSRAGGISGTPAYMAPEQWRGEECTPAADVWALGLILFELAAGRPPYDIPSRFVLGTKVAGPEPAPSLASAVDDVPTELVTLVDRCLAKPPRARPEIGEVVERLQELLAARARVTGRGRQPYRGLLPFSERHAHLFFGREAEIDAFLERIREDTVLPVVGPSGAGKSSFIRAGIIPRLKEQGAWEVIRMRPGSRPFALLAARLEGGEYVSSTQAESSQPELTETVVDSAHSGEGHAGPPDAALTGGKESSPLAAKLFDSPSYLSLVLQSIAEQRHERVLLFVDQLEELYTLVEDAEARSRFMRALCTAADDPDGPVRVIFTLRDDFLVRLAEGDEAREALGRVTVLRNPGTRALEEILVKPLNAAGYAFEDESIVREMIAEVGGETACLPLLQFAGQRLWENRDEQRRLLTRQAYDEMGGVAGNLAHHADGVLEGLPPPLLDTARLVFLQLVTPEGTRRTVSRHGLERTVGPEVSDVVDRLVQTRLVLVRKGSGQDDSHARLELAHESLISTWRTLAHWIDESREDLQFLVEVEQAATLWEKRGGREEEVWHGEALREALKTAERCFAQLSERALRFLEEGERLEHRQIRRRRFLRIGLVLISALVALVSISVALYVNNQRRIAEEGQRQAELGRAQAEIEGAMAALQKEDMVTARTKLLASLETVDSLSARSLFKQLQESPMAWKKEIGVGTHGLAFSPDGETLAMAPMDKGVLLLSIRDLTSRVLRGHADRLVGVSFSSNGRELASADRKGVVRFWQLPAGTTSLVEQVGREVESIQMSPDDRYIVVGDSRGRVHVRDRAAGARWEILSGHTDVVNWLSFSPQGDLLASASFDGTVRIWETRAWKTLRVLSEHKAQVYAVAFSPDGKLVASGGEDRDVIVTDLSSGTVAARLSGCGGEITNIAFSPDGAFLAAGSGDRTVRLWDTGNWRTLRVFRGHPVGVMAVAFSPDGRYLASADLARGVYCWRTNLEATRPQPAVHSDTSGEVAFSPDGSMLASTGSGGNIILREVATGRQLMAVKGHPDPAYGISFSPDGKKLATGSFDQAVRLWDAHNGAELARMTGHTAEVSEVTFSPDGRTLASGSYNGIVRLWDAASGKSVRVLPAHSGPAWGLSFSPDGKYLASTGHDKLVKVWEVASGVAKYTLSGHEDRIMGVDFYPDGRHLASASNDGTLRIWDLESRTGRILGKIDGRLYGVCYHPDGKRIGTTCSDGTAQIWEIATREYIELVGHAAEANDIAFSPAGRLAATTSDDGTVRVWQVADGRPYWRGPALLSSGGEVLTHNGWFRWRSEEEVPDDESQAWREAIPEQARQVSESPDGRYLCVQTFGSELEIWDVLRDKPLFLEKLTGLSRVLAIPGGCISLAGGHVRLYDTASSFVDLRSEAEAIGWHRGEILVAARGRVFSFDLSGHQTGSREAAPEMAAVARVHGRLVVGFRDGRLEFPGEPHLPAPSGFQESPPQPVSLLIEGPNNTLVAGYANGFVGLWSMEDGMLLDSTHLHGPVRHLVLAAPYLHILTELGDYLAWDLSVFHMSYEELLKEVRAWSG